MCQHDHAKSKLSKNIWRMKTTWHLSIWPSQEQGSQEQGPCHLEKSSRSVSIWPNQEPSYGEKTSWLMSIWPSQEQNLGNMEKNSWSVSMWPNQESSYGEKLLGSCQYDQTKSKDWASIGKSTNQRSKGIRREPWISPSCSTPPSLPLLTYVCGGFFLQQCMCVATEQQMK